MALDAACGKTEESAVEVLLQRSGDTLQFTQGHMRQRLLGSIPEEQGATLQAPEGRIFRLTIIVSGLAPVLAMSLHVRREAEHIFLETAMDAEGTVIDLAQSFAPKPPPSARSTDDHAAMADTTPHLPVQEKKSEEMPQLSIVSHGTEAALRAAVASAVSRGDPRASALAVMLLKRLTTFEESVPVKEQLHKMSDRHLAPFLADIVGRTLKSTPQDEKARRMQNALRMFCKELATSKGPATSWLKTLLADTEKPEDDIVEEALIQTVSGGKPLNFRRVMELLIGKATMHVEQGLRLLVQLTGNPASAAAAAMSSHELSALRQAEQLLSQASSLKTTNAGPEARRLHHVLRGEKNYSMDEIKRGVEHCRKDAEEKHKAKRGDAGSSGA